MYLNNNSKHYPILTIEHNETWIENIEYKIGKMYWLDQRLRILQVFSFIIFSNNQGKYFSLWFHSKRFIVIIHSKISCKTFFLLVAVIFHFLFIFFSFSFLFLFFFFSFSFLFSFRRPTPKSSRRRHSLGGWRVFCLLRDNFCVSRPFAWHPPFR